MCIRSPLVLSQELTARGLSGRYQKKTEATSEVHAEKCGTQEKGQLGREMMRDSLKEQGTGLPQVLHANGEDRVKGPQLSLAAGRGILQK